MIRFLFKQPRPRRFHFKPRFYDERKEQLNARVEAIRREVEFEQGQSSEAVMRSRLQSAWRTKSGVQTKRRSNTTVLIISVLLAVIAYLVLYR